MSVQLDRPDPAIAVVTINNQPRLNAMTRSMMADLGALWDQLDADDTRCIILTGAGDRAFCVGADLGGDLSAGPEMASVVNHALLKLDTFSKPIIAAVNGVCAGGGVELLLATDIRLAASGARFGLPEVRWSVYPFGGATTRLIRQIGYAHAMDLLLCGHMVDADEAARLGLINCVVPATDLMPLALDKARRIAANSPSAVQAVKTQVSATLAAHVHGREDMDQKLGDAVRAGPHFSEGVAAFLEKREPVY